jgi:FlgD Ig-like domain
VASSGTVIDRFDINTYNEDQLLADIAFNNQNYLIAWSDRRNGPDHVYYTMVTPEGNVINDSGIILTENDSCDYSTLPAVATNQNQYLVAWLGVRIRGDVILGARIDASGVIVDTIPFEFSSDTLLLDRVAISSNGQDYLVVWSGETPGLIGSDLYGRRISTTGEMLDTVPILIARSPQGLSEPAVTFSSGYYFVVWNGMNEIQNIYGCRIRPDGTILDPGGFPICTDTGVQLDPAIATDGERFLVTWADRQSGNYDIGATLVDTAGNVGVKIKPIAAEASRSKIDIRPVPFKTKTIINLDLPFLMDVRLNIYDAFGKLVRTFISNKTLTGEHQFIWDGTDTRGRTVSNGTYFCQLRAGAKVITKRIIRIK